MKVKDYLEQITFSDLEVKTLSGVTIGNEGSKRFHDCEVVSYRRSNFGKTAELYIEQEEKWHKN